VLLLPLMILHPPLLEPGFGTHYIVLSDVVNGVEMIVRVVKRVNPTVLKRLLEG